MGAYSLDAVVARSLRAHGLVEPVASIGEATVVAAGIYGSSPTSHLGLAARLDGYAPSMLERARLEERSILRVPGMRGSVFLAPQALVPAMLGLSRPLTVRRTLAGAGMAEAELERLMGLVDDALAGTSLTAREIRTFLGADDPGGPSATLVLRGMAHEGRIVAAEPVGGERATAFRYARMSDWAPDVGPRLEVEPALAVMAPIWMRANGPGTVDDLAWWAGVTKARAKAALLAMNAETVELEGLEGEQWATDEVLEGIASAEPCGLLRLLPVWDAWLMARRERSRLLDRAYRPYVVDKSGNVTNTITLDGRIVGTWDIDGPALLIHTFEAVSDADLHAAADRLRPLFDWFQIRPASSPKPLDEGGQNAFRTPLR